ncbi:MAG: ribonuclease domain-containing protein [Mycobacterium sp.]|uniref:ribonuclease domain-containing protein n=1 Tax=Mycobacterium sp. TaxID=1785 RepID=UPI003F95AADA
MPARHNQPLRACQHRRHTTDTAARKIEARGGSSYENRDGNLPTTDGSGKPITYQEWDVNPKAPGQNRGNERIVTGSDGSAWYTPDHYGTFQRLR